MRRISIARISGIAALVVLCAAAIGHAASAKTDLDDRTLDSRKEMKMKKITPLLTVEAIEPALPFWEALGFTRTAEVPTDEGLVFVSLQKDAVELMYQTWSSLEAAADVLPTTPRGAAFLFIEVVDLDAVEAALSDHRPLKPRETTFYGADELVFQEPGGNVVTFAQFAEEGSD